jgi:glycosyltransferase involved in cell wall biosynthesis
MTGTGHNSGMTIDHLLLRAPLVSAVMPCLNEERTLAVCIRKAQQCMASMGVAGEVVIADNGSTDRSVEIALSLGARVVTQPVPGYGAALMAGIGAARGEFVVLADADDSYDWSGMAPFIEALRSGLDLVVGNRFLGGIDPGAMPPLHRYLGNPVLSLLARAVHKVPVGDFHCGMRALRRDVWEKLQVRTPGMEFATELIVNAAQIGLRIGEVPTTLKKDGRDRPPHLRSFRDGWRHLRFILSYGPNHLFMAPGAALLLPGALLVGALAAGPITLGGHYFGIHFLALGCLLTLLGYNVINLGLFAKVIVMRGQSRLSAWARSGFTLERGLLTGLAIAAIGVTVDVRLLLRWLAPGAGDMTDSVHPVFVATLAIVVGVNVIFNSFLLSLLLSEQAPTSATTNLAHRERPARPAETVPLSDNDPSRRPG